MSNVHKQMPLNRLVLYAVLWGWPWTGYAATAFAQTTDDSVILQAEQQALRQAADSASKYVVQIETFGGLDRIEEQSVAEGPTTGTIVGSDGWVITSLHALRQQPASILVALGDGQRVAARVVARDFSRELALLKLETAAVLPAAPASDLGQLRVGQWCIAIGKTYDPQSITQSHGIISALGRAYGRAVQTDAKVSPINYGGPLVDLHGQVIGILAPIAASEMLEGDGSVLYDSGIGFAIPLTDVLQRLPTMQAGEDIHPGRLGIVARSQNDLEGPVRLSGSAPGSPAARAGVLRGDVVIQAQGMAVQRLADLRQALAQTDAGQQFELGVLRDGKRVTLNCQLVAEIPTYRRRYLGLRVEAASDGLKVTSVAKGSPAERAGLRADQLLTDCNAQPLRSASDLAQLLAVSELGIPLTLSVRPADSPASKSVTIEPQSWPAQLPEQDWPVIVYSGADGQLDENAKAQITELKLADIPNQIAAIIPPAVGMRPLGCLILFGQPGETDSERLKSQWEEFAKNYGWIVVAPAAADPQAWSRDEIELAARLLARLEQEYVLDSRRTVIGGIGVGGQLAIMAGMMHSQRVAGVFTLGTALRSFAPRQPGAPLQTMDFLFVSDKPLDPLVERLNRLGYVTHAVVAPDIDTSKWNTVPFATLARWLESLGQL
ncbi:MAG: PDZ domain-containing protein [Pirellulaceae bacterium]|nr:PDZ domain-containing protein [Pirellulaceae bacterium]